MDRFNRDDEFSSFNPNDLIVRVITADGSAREFTASPDVVNTLKAQYRTTITRNKISKSLTKICYVDGGISVMGDEELASITRFNAGVPRVLHDVKNLTAPKEATADAQPPVMFSADNRVVVTFDQGTRRSHVERTNWSFNLNEVVAIRIRPLGRGDHMEDRRFVEVKFNGGGFLRAIASLEEANAFDTAAYELFAGNAVDQACLTWNAGTYEILLRADTIAGYDIDQHEQRQDTRPRPQFRPQREYRERSHGYGGGGGGGGYDGSGYGGYRDRRNDRGGRRERSDYRPVGNRFR